MDIRCRFVQGKLARAAVLGQAPPSESSQGRHLARCAACRTAWQELSGLAATLPSQAPPAGVPDSFNQAVLLRVAERQMQATEPARVRRRPAPALAALAVALGFAVWIGRPQPAPGPPPTKMVAAPAASSGTGIHETLAGTHAEQPRTPSGSGSEREVLPRQRPVVSMGRRGPERRGRIGRRGIGRRILARAHRVRKRQPERAVPAPTVASPPSRRDELLARALWLEAQGHDRLAAADYGEVFAEQRDPSLALAAGRTAERAGEITQALAYYEQLLTPAAGDTEEENGER